MAWIWKDQPEDGDRFFATYDHQNSTLRPYLLLGPEPIPPEAGEAFLDAKRYSPARIRRYGCLPAASDERVVHMRLKEFILLHLKSSDVQFYPMTVKAKGGEAIDEFFALIPLHEVTCTDISRSEITGWIVEGEAATGFKSISHLEGCLGSLRIARDSVTGHVLVSEKLKQLLETTKEPGLYFARPEDLRPIYY